MLRTQPSLPIAGTLASDDEDSESGDDLSDALFSNNIVAFPVLAPTAAAPAPAAAPIELNAPLPVYEDRGGVAGGRPAAADGQNDQPMSAPGPVPQSLTALPDPAPGALASQPAEAHASLSLAGRPLGANWWEGGGAAEQPLNQARPPPAVRAPVFAGPPPGPAFTNLHHEVIAFAHRASPSQVRSKGVELSGWRAAIKGAPKGSLSPSLFSLALSPSLSHQPHRPKPAPSRTPSPPSAAWPRPSGRPRKPSCSGPRRRAWPCRARTWTLSSWARRTSWKTRRLAFPGTSATPWATACAPC